MIYWKGKLALSKVSLWLGTLSWQRYCAICTGSMGTLCMLLIIRSIIPALAQHKEAARISQVVQDHQRRIEELLSMVEYQEDSNQRDASVTPVTSERLFDVLNDSATRSHISIRSFARGGTTSSSAAQLEDHHFTARGSFEQLRAFVNYIAQHEAALVISSAVIENSLWPDFNDELQARFTVARAR